MDAEREVLFSYAPQAPGPTYGGGEGQAYHFENALELLDESGEWYLATDTNQLYYKPRSGEDMATAEVVVPRLESLVRLQGDPADPVHDVEFQGITFEHTTWLAPSSEGYIGAQSATQFGAPLFDRATAPLAGARRDGVVHPLRTMHVPPHGCIGVGLLRWGNRQRHHRQRVRRHRRQRHQRRPVSLTAVDIDEAHPLVRDPATLCKRNVI